MNSAGEIAGIVAEGIARMASRVRPSQQFEIRAAIVEATLAQMLVIDSGETDAVIRGAIKRIKLDDALRDSVELAARTSGKDEIIAEVCDDYGVSVADVMGPSLLRYITEARQAVYWRLRQERNAAGRPRWSLPTIAGFMGRDHTSILKGIRQHEIRLAERRKKAAKHKPAT